MHTSKHQNEDILYKIFIIIYNNEDFMRNGSRFKISRSDGVVRTLESPTQQPHEGSRRVTEVTEVTEAYGYTPARSPVHHIAT